MPSWSPYAYTFNNPIRFVDPDGREPRPRLLILSYRGLIGGWNVSSRSSESVSFNLPYGFSKYIAINYPVSGVQVNIGFDSFYFKDITTAWAYIKAINNLDAINNNEAHHVTFNKSVKIGRKTYNTSERPQNYDDGYATGQAISELGCNCGAVMMGALGAFAGRVSNTDLPISNRIRGQKQLAEHVVGGSRLGNNSYLNSLDDATEVLNAANSGKAKILSTNSTQNRAYVEYKGVTGYYNNNGVSVPTNKFMIKGRGSNGSTVIPIHPKSTRFK